VRVSDIDEPAELGRAGISAPDEVPLFLARRKAESVAEAVATTVTDADLIVLGCDSILDFEGETLGKPANATEATTRWRRMRGRSGVLRTGHWLIDARDDGTGGSVGASSETVVHFAEVSDAEIDAYVATGEPLRVAGAFTVDGLGGAFVRGIEGDHHGVVGVSLPLVRDLLAEVKVGWTDLWVRPPGAAEPSTAPR
jgi:nucleoside triphosphate pyrophosphatase